EASHFQLFGENSKPIHHLHIKDGTVTVMSAEEAQVYRKSDAYYNLTLGFNDPSHKLNNGDKLKIQKIKFLNGESQFTTEELELLKKWFARQGVENMQLFYEEYVLASENNKLKAAEYHHGESSLKRLFSEMR
ncbi:MAG: hypothetical protein H0T62_05285, partial [Parachlamydiaceae bacterium]|nr:hypothetical protein [Parachlamydiaceae bacterium]